MRAREPGLLVASRYRLEKRLSRSLRGEVWFARDLQVDEEIVLRVFPGRPASAEEQMAALASLKSPHLPRLLAWGADDDDTFLVTARVSGEDLSRYLSKLGPMPQELLLTVIEHTARGLDALHALGLVHGDVKPQNVILAATVPPHAVLIDIEGAAVHGLGTPLYMAPERFSPVAPQIRDPRSDLYSLGIAAFELATGKPPFYSDRAAELGALHVSAARPKIHDLDPALPVELSELVAKLIRVDPRERYQTARGLAADAESLRLALRKRLPWRGVGRADLARADTALVGRETEWRRLVSLTTQALEGNVATLAIVGPAGIGKSRLLARLRSLAEGRGFSVHHRSCSGTAAAGSLSPFRRLLAAWTDAILRADSAVRVAAIARVVEAAGGALYRVLQVFPSLAPLVAGHAGAARPHEDARDQAMFLEAVARLVLVACGDGEAALLLDDIDGADDATQDVLRRLPRLARGRPFLLVVAGRSVPWAEAAGLAELTLPPLDHSASTELALACGAPELASALAEDIASASGGNPGLIEELVRLRRAGHTQLPGDRFEALLESRVAELEPGVREVLAAAAELGDDLAIEHVAIATTRTEDDVSRALATAAAVGVVRATEEGRWVFPFPQVRARLRDGLAAERRRVLHARVLERLSETGELDAEPRAAAEHAIGADDRAAIAKYLPIAAEEAARAFDLAKADALFAECLRHGVRDQVSVALERSKLAVLAGRYAEGRAVLDAAEEKATTAAERAAILERKAQLAFRASDIEGATRALEGALELEGERLYHGALGVGLVGAWRFFRALVRGGPKARGGDASLAHRVRLYEALVPLYFWHQPSKMLPVHLRQLELAEQLGSDRERSSVYMHHAHVCQFARLDARARSFVDAADQLRSESPDPWDRAVARFERGTAAHRRGDWLVAQDDLRIAAQEILALGDPYQGQIAMGSLCMNCIQLAELDEFDWAANLSHDLAVASGDLRGEAWGLGWRSYGLMMRGKPREALELLARAEEISKRVHDLTSVLLIHRMQSEALLVAAELDQAIALITDTVRQVRKLTLRIDLLDGIEVVAADALTQRHLAGVPGASMRELARAVKRGVEVGRRHHAWRSLSRRVEARFVALRGDVPGAVKRLEALEVDARRVGEHAAELAARVELERLTGAWRRVAAPPRAEEKALSGIVLPSIDQAPLEPSAIVAPPTTKPLPSSLVNPGFVPLDR
ncbi:AAA family ATPase [Myxococcota bacterium]|nr:AAA family ATPase [Myxococcota bacterium]